MSICQRGKSGFLWDLFFQQLPAGVLHGPGLHYDWVCPLVPAQVQWYSDAKLRPLEDESVPSGDELHRPIQLWPVPLRLWLSQVLGVLHQQQVWVNYTSLNLWNVLNVDLSTQCFLICYILRPCDATNLNLSPLCNILSVNNDKEVREQVAAHNDAMIQYQGDHVGRGGKGVLWPHQHSGLRQQHPGPHEEILHQQGEGGQGTALC